MMVTYVAPIELKTVKSVKRDVSYMFFTFFITYSYLKRKKKENGFFDNKLACKVAED